MIKTTTNKTIKKEYKKSKKAKQDSPILKDIITQTKALKIGSSKRKALAAVKYHKYFNILMNPFSQLKCGIPDSARYGKTYCFQRMYINSYQTNVNGNMLMQWKPRYISNTSANLGPLFVDNSPTYDPNTGNAQASSPGAANLCVELGYNSADVKNVSLVAAGMRIYFENPATVLQPKGRIYIAKEVEQAGGFNNPANTHKLSFVTSNKEHRDYKNSNMTQIECIYVPSSISQTNMVISSVGIYENETYTYDPSDEFTLIFTRFDVQTQVYVELYYNYECVPVATGAFRDLPEFNDCYGLSTKHLSALRSTGLQIREEPLASDHNHIADRTINVVKSVAGTVGSFEFAIA